MTHTILSANKVTKRFGGLTAVNNIDIEVKENSIHSVIGPNGAGKTTFFNCLTGFYKPEEGELLFNGHSLVGLRSDQIIMLGIARTYQNIRLFANLTALDNVLIGQHIHLKAGWLGSALRFPGIVREEKAALAEANRLLNFVGLANKGNHIAKNLSYGDQRRLEIARALASKPKLLLLDEPTAGMNPHETEEATIFFRALRDKFNITIVLIEHDMRVVMGISEIISVLDYGEKIAEGTPKEIQNNAHVIEAYLGRGSAGNIGKDPLAVAQEA
ncbi:MAG: ABC transporter ATP-binding protein [Chloroflexota bacterium]